MHFPYKESVPKHFNRLHQLLLDKYLNTSNRIRSRTKNNRHTKTFIKFSVKKCTFYLGPYYGCHCSVPSPYVMSCNRFCCATHNHEINKTHDVHHVTSTLGFYRNQTENCAKTNRVIRHGRITDA